MLAASYRLPGTGTFTTAVGLILAQTLILDLVTDTCSRRRGTAPGNIASSASSWPQWPPVVLLPWFKGSASPIDNVGRVLPAAGSVHRVTQS